MDKKTVAITGSHGFLGKHLSGILMEQGFKVYGVERRELENPDTLEGIMHEIMPTYIFHLSAYGNMYNQTFVDEIVTTNYLKTFFLLRATKDIPYLGLINVSSSSIYGIKKKKMKETQIPETTSFYGATKVGAEYLARAYSDMYKKPIVTIRPFSIYGPGEADFRFVPTVIHALETGKSLTLDPYPVHDWVFVEDVVNAMIMIAIKANKFKGEIFNVGTGIQSSNEFIVSLLKNISGHKPLEIIKSEKHRPYETTSWKADTQKIRSIGWTPRYSLLEGLKETYEWYKKQGFKA